MTDCPDARQFAAYLEGTCDELAAERLERHAGSCEVCYAKLEAATRVPEVATLAATLPPPADARRLVVGAVAARRTRRRVLRWGGVIAAALVLVMIGSLAGPPPKEASTRPPMGPPLALDICEPAEGVQIVRVTQAIGTLTVEAVAGVSDVTWSGMRDDLTQVSVHRIADTLALAVTPRDRAKWPAEAHGRLVVPVSMRVVVVGRGLLVRDLGGTGGIRVVGRGELEAVARPR